MAIQAGLLTSAITQSDPGNSSLISRLKITSSFLVAKILAYTLLGILLGSLGSFLTISLRLQGWLQVAIGIYMLTTVGRLLNLHPIFNYLVVKPPSWVYRLMKREAKSASIISAGFMGLLTVLMPCGVTQAMMVLAVGSGSALLGAGIMFAFTLGTSPLFFLLGAVTSQLLTNRKLEIAAATLILFFSVLSINGGLGLLGSIYTLQNFYKAATVSSLPVKGSVAGVDQEGKQEATIVVRSSGYSANKTALRSGIPVKLTLLSQNAAGCARAFTIPKLNITKILPANGTETVEFTPARPGRLAFSCSMGMFTGSFEII